ncbi:hypothetical protein Agub_g748 [Astrephomene gubernaculifera]|uniref:Ribosomal protein S4 n=1 Tax=Astrephomene gubernaculifera TaxID=47775 RepID=A0AAD3HG83_9CHLO|nr:hypothetical protein Agub_g748 [Astrephomene gubernaculifera]
MQRTLRTLVSRCIGASCGSAGAQQTGALALNGISTSGVLVQNQPLSTSAVASARALLPAALLASAPRSCWWMMQLAQAPDAPSTSRHYAKAAKGGAPAAAAAPTGPKRHRTSSTKLYSCRNDRLRHTHEQIWPTMQLTEAEAAMFRRNSRLFVVDMGRNISLQTKFRMGQQDPAQQAEAAEAEAAGVPAPPVSRAVPYHQARNLLYETQLHLDALGENPRYLRVRKVGSLYAAKLQNVRKLRLLLGFQRRGYVQKMYEQSLITRGPHRMWKMVCAMESKLPMFVTRMGLVEDSVGAMTALKYDKVYVNGMQPAMPYKGYLTPGDVVSPSAGSTPYFRKRIAKSLEPLLGEAVRCVV